MTDFDSFEPWFLPDHDSPAGYVSHIVASRLRDEGLLTPQERGLALTGASNLDAALDYARALLAAAGLIGPPRGEAMPVLLLPDGPVIGIIDRSAMRILGLWAVKVHINGIVREGNGLPSVWLSRRSLQSAAAPGAYDTMVAGGQAAGMSIAETVAKEAREEVGLPRGLAATARHVRDIPVHYITEQGLHREMLAIYDLDIPADFLPVHIDGEIESSILLSWHALKAGLLGALPFKQSSHLVCSHLVERLEPQGVPASAPGS